MSKPWDITKEEAIAAGERKRKRREAADREDAPLLARMLAENEEFITEVVRAHKTTQEGQL
ncbi:MAG: hypothetical protein PHD51_04020 [Patescibacteria group bacterium]|nr:hypothetical protein [Patescibacteria group bacterium]MDD5490869.1 hypothetical protein [Patescibacteria group bacterium]